MLSNFQEERCVCAENVTKVRQRNVEQRTSLNFSNQLHDNAIEIYRNLWKVEKSSLSYLQELITA